MNMYLHGDDEENGNCDYNDNEVKWSQNTNEWLDINKCQVQTTGHLPINAVTTETELGEAAGSNRCGLGSFFSKGFGGGERVVPNNPTKGSHGVGVPCCQLALASGALEKILSFPRACH